MDACGPKIKILHFFEKSGIRNIDFDLNKSAVSELKALWKNYSKNIEPYPENFISKGIVTCAGGLRYFYLCLGYD